MNHSTHTAAPGYLLPEHSYQSLQELRNLMFLIACTYRARYWLNASRCSSRNSPTPWTDRDNSYPCKTTRHARIDPCRRPAMKEPTTATWIPLNTSYYISPICDPGKLLDDAGLLLSGAHGITQILSDLLNQDADIHPDTLANALWGVSLLIQMGQGSAEEAQGRLRRIGV
jgi:hypothetical protein